MKTYTLERDQWIPRPLEELLPFFADARNLEAITPPWLHFGLLPPVPESVEQGVRIEYRLKLGGIPIRWRTRIRDWDPPRGFVDVQERGPFALWEHSHHFQSLPGGVVMRDVVRYAPPLGPLGRVAHALALRSTLSAIFDHRFARVAERFSR